ncbi:DUF2752 domain-containing protein [Hufsiella ginkgonis]|uniref:DUF2752 domain-containing protein n=1 Tax=Hufsiella ginkgonis TaxID=2695274 RepID=A0A7K1Y2S8_9SPHI|nr:DUF2752 domain-containing protein [Hufsiella ginkgonis]MXV17560.1 DUF2752 domain-containing protein [Hufsiella ginkgonis]
MKRPEYYLLPVVTVAALAVIYVACDPVSPAFFLHCPFRRLTGLDCPGCGSQRAFHALLHGEVARAADYNLLLVVSLPFLPVYTYYRLRTATGDTRRWQLPSYRYTPHVIFGLVAGFWLLRNLPVYPFTYLAS